MINKEMINKERINKERIRYTNCSIIIQLNNNIVSDIVLIIYISNKYTIWNIV